jgi:hypothetical protein
MESLFDKWKTKIPKYSEVHKDLFDSLSQKYGAEGEKKVNLGKHFSTNYELYIYAFFLGLYAKEKTPIPFGEKKIDFSHHIQYWGNKNTTTYRKDFSALQEYMYMALIAKTEVDILSLDKDEVSEDEIVKELINTMESFTNGGLNLIRDKIEVNSNHFLNPTSFLDMILKNNLAEDYNQNTENNFERELVFSTDKKQFKVDKN